MKFCIRRTRVFARSEWPKCVAWRCVAGRHPSPRLRTFPARPPTPAALPASWRSTRQRRSTTLDRWVETGRVIIKVHTFRSLSQNDKQLLAADDIICGSISILCHFNCGGKIIVVFYLFTETIEAKDARRSDGCHCVAVMAGLKMHCLAIPINLFIHLSQLHHFASTKETKKMQIQSQSRAVVLRVMPLLSSSHVVGKKWC